jgi:hypothetical protein
MSHADFRTLTHAQRVWIKLYLGTGDALRATRIAYPRVSAKTLPSRVCHIQAHPKIARLLRLAYGAPEPDQLVETLIQSIRKSIKRDGGLSEHTTAAIRLYTKLAGKKLKGVSNAK